MKVDAVSGIGFRNGNINFGEKQRVHEGAPVSRPSGVSDLAKVPVIVLLAMNPATLNSALPTMPETGNLNKITILAPETKSSDATTYVIVPETEEVEQSNPPFGWALFRDVTEDIKLNVPAKGNGANYHMVFTAPRSSNDKINNIYFIKDGSVGSVDPGDHPAKVQTLIYHNLGDASFCSVITLENILGPDRMANGTMMREIMIDDASAQKIIDLVSGDTKWKNNTHIQVNEVFDAKIHKSKTVLY